MLREGDLLSPLAHIVDNVQDGNDLYMQPCPLSNNDYGQPTIRKTYTSLKITLHLDLLRLIYLTPLNLWTRYLNYSLGWVLETVLAMWHYTFTCRQWSVNDVLESLLNPSPQLVKFVYTTPNYLIRYLALGSIGDILCNDFLCFFRWCLSMYHIEDDVTPTISLLTSILISCTLPMKRWLLQKPL